MGNYLATPQPDDGDRHAPPPAAQQHPLPPPAAQQHPLPPPAAQQLPLPLPLPEVCESFTCEICIEPIEDAAQNFRPKNANCAAHRFCNDCMIKYIGAKLDDNIPKIPCPAPTCPEFLDPLEHRALLGQPLFVRWCDALCELALVGTEQCYCPNRNCSALVVNECGGGATVKKAACPGCKRAFCFQCKLPWHAGFRCGELTDQNDRAFGALAERRRWRRCPQCDRFVELVRGCRMIKCRCGASFCYTCGGRPPGRCACNVHVRNQRWVELLWVFGVFIICCVIAFPLVNKFCSGENSSRCSSFLPK